MTNLLDQELKHRVKTAYIPAFNRSFLTPFYDFMMKYAARESAFKPELVEQARIEKGHRVLDLGCGTATLTILIKKTLPQAEVRGVDADPKILEIAQSKAARAGADIHLDHGTATDLPYSANSFDRVFSSMVFHHLSREDKIRTLGEAYRILKPGGELHLADFGRPQNALMHLPSLIIRRLEETSDLTKGFLPDMIQNAGFKRVEQTAKYMTIFGTFTLYKAQKPWEPSDKKASKPRTDKYIDIKNGNRETVTEENEYYDSKLEIAISTSAYRFTSYLKSSKWAPILQPKQNESAKSIVNSLPLISMRLAVASGLRYLLCSSTAFSTVALKTLS